MDLGPDERITWRAGIADRYDKLLCQEGDQIHHPRSGRWRRLSQRAKGPWNAKHRTHTYQVVSQRLSRIRSQINITRQSLPRSVDITHSFFFTGEVRKTVILSQCTEQFTSKQGKFLRYLRQKYVKTKGSDKSERLKNEL